MREYHDLLHVNHEKIDGIGPWLWIAEDWEGFRWPKEDWPDHKATWSKHIKKWDVCVQAGGLQGMYPRLLSEMFGLVYTFEPDPLHFFCLTNNCQKDNIIKMQMALGHMRQMIDIETPCTHNRGMGKVATGNKIPMTTIDCLRLNACDFIQLDTEGYEYKILEGALLTIEEFKPVISCERKHGEEDVLSFIEVFGYEIVDQSHSDTIFAVTR